MSVKSSCVAAGFEPRTSFARASRLLERDDVRALVLASIHDDEGGVFPAASADPAPVGSVGDAKDGGDVPVSLDNVRESPAATGGAISTPQKSRMAPKKRAKAHDGECSRRPHTRIPGNGVPAPSAPEDEDIGRVGSTLGATAEVVSASENVKTVETVTDADDASPANIAANTGDGSSAEDCVQAPCLEQVERRILAEYEKIAFAESTKDSVVKPADKLRALEQYRSIIERQTRRVADLAEAKRQTECEARDRLTVVYDYGDECEPD